MGEGVATRLREDGVEARLDDWHLPNNGNIAEFMNREVREADWVLVLCSPGYQHKVRATEDGERVSGVGWESGCSPAGCWSAIRTRSSPSWRRTVAECGAGFPAGADLISIFPNRRHFEETTGSPELSPARATRRHPGRTAAAGDRRTGGGAALPPGPEPHPRGSEGVAARWPGPDGCGTAPAILAIALLSTSAGVVRPGQLPFASVTFAGRRLS